MDEGGSEPCYLYYFRFLLWETTKERRTPPRESRRMRRFCSRTHLAIILLMYYVRYVERCDAHAWCSSVLPRATRSACGISYHVEHRVATHNSRSVFQHIRQINPVSNDSEAASRTLSAMVRDTHATGKTFPFQPARIVNYRRSLASESLDDVR